MGLVKILAQTMTALLMLVVKWMSKNFCFEFRSFNNELTFMCIIITCRRFNAISRAHRRKSSDGTVYRLSHRHVVYGIIFLMACEVLCAIWYHLYNLKKREKNIHGGVLLFVKATLLHGCISPFLNCTNGTKSRKASHMKEDMLPLEVKFVIHCVTSYFKADDSRYRANITHSLKFVSATFFISLFCILKREDL